MNIIIMTSFIKHNKICINNNTLFSMNIYNMKGIVIDSFTVMEIEKMFF